MDCNHLKIGDKVIVRHSRSNEVVSEVTRLTAKQLVVRGLHYWKKNGNRVGDGDSLHISWLHPYSEDKAKAIKARMLRQSRISTMRNCNPDTLDDHQLQQIVTIIQSTEKK